MKINKMDEDNTSDLKAYVLRTIKEIRCKNERPKDKTINEYMNKRCGIISIKEYVCLIIQPS